jgi:hypothetical protein
MGMLMLSAMYTLMPVYKTAIIYYISQSYGYLWIVDCNLMMRKSVFFIPNTAAIGLLYFSTLIYSSEEVCSLNQV